MVLSCFLFGGRLLGRKKVREPGSADNVGNYWFFKMEKDLIKKVKDVVKRDRFSYTKDAHKDAYERKLLKKDVKERMLKGFHVTFKEIYSEEEIEKKIQDKRFLHIPRNICYLYQHFKRDIIICYNYYDRKRSVKIIHIGEPTQTERTRLRDVMKKFKVSKGLFLQIMKFFLPFVQRRIFLFYLL